MTTTKADCFVSVVAPLRNDADIVQPFLEELVECLRERYTDYEVVLVDDGSEDDTVEQARVQIGRYQDVRLLRLSRSFGQETAITAGLESVIGDYVVVMLPDSDPPEVIPEMIERARKGVGIVVALRQGPRSEGLLFRFGAALFYAYANGFLKLGIPPESVDFRVLSRKSVNALIQIRDHLRYIRSFSAYVGYGTETIPYTPISRRGKPDKRRLFEAVSLGINLIVANSSHPLRLMSIIALLLSGGAAFYALWYAGLRLFAEGTPAGWVTTLAWISAPFFFLFLIIAVLCEYLGRILVEIQDRPLYFIAEEWDHGSAVVDEERKNIVHQSADD
ncbi:MAG: glycosyltransferase family 2 protein [Planctomycetota bacterium]|nr:glycosyltransferase family 2 protein [Planctomycetota bacterium]